MEEANDPRDMSLEQLQAGMLFGGNRKAYSDEIKRRQEDDLDLKNWWGWLNTDKDGYGPGKYSATHCFARGDDQPALCGVKPKNLFDTFGIPDAPMGNTCRNCQRKSIDIQRRREQ